MFGFAIGISNRDLDHSLYLTWYSAKCVRNIHLQHTMVFYKTEHTTGEAEEGAATAKGV